MRSSYEEVHCNCCGGYTKQKYLGKSKKSRNSIFTFLKFYLYECCECGELNYE